MPFADSIVDWAALGQVVVYAFAGTVAVSLLFTAGVLLIGEEPRRTPAPRLAVAGAAFAASLALVVLGLYVMLTSK
jgi:NADH:ubiquinone oxidoreductase subunit 6 (subunit J)